MAFHFILLLAYPASAPTQRPGHYESVFCKKGLRFPVSLSSGQPGSWLMAGPGLHISHYMCSGAFVPEKKIPAWREFQELSSFKQRKAKQENWLQARATFAVAHLALTQKNNMPPFFPDWMNRLRKGILQHCEGCTRKCLCTAQSDANFLESSYAECTKDFKVYDKFKSHCSSWHAHSSKNGPQEKNQKYGYRTDKTVFIGV